VSTKKSRAGDRFEVCQAGSESMEKVYSYKGFKVTVKLVDVRAVSSDFAFGPPVGYVAEVSICTAEPRRPIGLPMRLVTEGNRIFGTEDDALTAGFGVAQRLLDDRVGP
jgi:hypothetical protein